LVVLGSLAFLTASLFLAHSLQSGRIARALLSQAKKAEDLGREEKAVRFLGRYLEFAPDDVEERAHLARLLAGEPPSGSPPDAGGRSSRRPQMPPRALSVLEPALPRAPNSRA